MTVSGISDRKCLKLGEWVMKKIIVVEEDPIVWLDLSELLAARFGAGLIERRSLAEVTANLSELAQSRAALVLSDLPEPLDRLAEAIERGLKLVITNTVSPDESVTLKGARIVGRPFEPSTLIEALISSAPHLLPGGKALQEG
jgi:hypothetical protein